jgi:hypothetical protein
VACESVGELAERMQASGCVVNRKAVALVFKEVGVRMGVVSSGTLRKFCRSGQAETRLSLSNFLEGAVPMLQEIDSELRILQKTCGEGELAGYMMGPGSRVTLDSI